jgi:dTDP-4-amino-4,6-dideoxygalactose transaminase
MTISMEIPMSSPDITSLERDAVSAVMKTTSLSIGRQVESFERKVAEAVGGGYAVAVNSGTSGLHLAVIAAGAGEGDAVITTPFSFIASANAILYERATPIFVDVDPVSGNIDPALFAECVGDMMSGSSRADRWLPPRMRGSRVRLAAVLPVHAFGQPAEMDAIHTAVQPWSLPVIEDSCEAIGASYKGRPAGTLGDAGVFAFYPNKQMTTGEGGVIVTRNEEWAQLFRSLRNQGRDVFDAWLNHTRLGYNYRLDELSSALGVAQLSRLDELVDKRERVAAWYNERLAGSELIELPHILPTTTRMSWFVYVVRVQPPAQRDRVLELLAADGIPSRPYFTPIHLQPFYAKKYGYERGDFPVTERLGDVSLALPFSSVMTVEQVDRVCDRLRAAVASTAGGEAAAR